MGAGDEPAGMSVAGFDSVVPAPALAPPFLPRAPYFDPSQRRFFSTYEDLKGLPPADPPTYIDMHPIMAIVVLRLSTQQGQSKSAINLGHQLAIILMRQPPARVGPLAYTEVARVLQDLIQNGDILLISVTADTGVRGRNLFAVSFANLRDPATNKRFPLTNAQTVNVRALPTTTL